MPTRRGRQVWRYRTLPSRWTEGGTVHLVYRNEERERVQACGRTSYSDVTDNEPVTCQRCLASGWVPAKWMPKEAQR